MAADAAPLERAEQWYVASQYRLMWRRLTRHRLAIVGGVVLAVLYLIAMFCEFIAPYDPSTKNTALLTAPPQRIHFFGAGGVSLRPFVYAYTASEDPVTWRKIYQENKEARYPIRWFVRGDEYRFWGCSRLRSICSASMTATCSCLAPTRSGATYSAASCTAHGSRCRSG